MRLVVDANVIFSALIKDSFTAELMFSRQLRLFMPKFMLDEFAEHEELIARKSGKSLSDLRRAFEIMRSRIHLSEDEEYEELLPSARLFCPDMDDMAYFALALRLNCPIWSNDRLLKKQEIVKIYSTSELKEILGL